MVVGIEVCICILQYRFYVVELVGLFGDYFWCYFGIVEINVIGIVVKVDQFIDISQIGIDLWFGIQYCIGDDFGFGGSQLVDYFGLDFV